MLGSVQKGNVVEIEFVMVADRYPTTFTITIPYTSNTSKPQITYFLIIIVFYLSSIFFVI